MVVQPKNQENIVNVPVESFAVKESAFEGGKSYVIEGMALPFNQFSRNGVLYRKESIEKRFETLKNRPLLFNHKMENLPIGLVSDVYVREDGLYYRAEIDADEVQIANKIKKGYLQNVSIQCSYDNPVYKEDGTVELDVKEFLELSVVTVPGFADTTAVMIEKLKMAKEKEVKEQTQVQPEDSEKESTVVEQEDEETQTLEQQVNMLVEAHEEVLNRLSILETRLDALEGEEDEDEESEEKSDKPEDEEEEKYDDKEKEESFKRRAIPSASQEKNTVVNLTGKRRFGY